MVINTLYLDNGVLNSIKRTYQHHIPNNIMLKNFFQKSIFFILQKKLYNSNYSFKFHPYKYKYFTTESREISLFLKGKYFDNLVKKILNIKKYGVKYEIRKFEPSTYTLLHDAKKDESGVDFVIDFSRSSRNFGGYTTYLTESKELLTLNPSPNTLSFIQRSNGVMKYVKYVTHQQEYPIIQVVGTICQKPPVHDWWNVAEA